MRLSCVTAAVSHQDCRLFVQDSLLREREAHVTAGLARTVEVLRKQKVGRLLQ